MNAINQLHATLCDHGFLAAAAALATSETAARAALVQWQLYPRCMDVYPKIITGKRAA